MTSTILNAYFDYAPSVAHFDSNWPTLKLETKFVHPSRKPKLKNYESVQHRLQFSGIKKEAKISFHRHFNSNNIVPQPGEVDLR